MSFSFKFVETSSPDCSDVSGSSKMLLFMASCSKCRVDKKADQEVTALKLATNATVENCLNEVSGLGGFGIHLFLKKFNLIL